MAQIIDPWGGFNQGIQSLNQSLSDIRRQKAEDLELESRGLQNKTAAVQLQDLLLKQQQNQELRNAMNAPAETVTDTQFVPSQVSPSVDMLNRMPGQQAASVSPFTSDQPQQPPVFNTPGEIKSTTATIAPNKTKIAIDYWESVGNLDKANAIRSEVAKQAKDLVDATGNPMAGIEHLNKTLGTNYQTMKIHSYDILKDGDGSPIAIFDKMNMEMLQNKGLSPSDAAQQSMIPLNLPGTSGQIVSEFLAKNPNPTPQQLWDLANKHNIPLKKIEPIISLTQKGQNQKPVDVVTQEASTFLTGKGYDLTTPEKQAEAFKWFATPQGQAEWLKYVDRVSASRYNPPPATNIVLGANPETGNIVIGNSRGPINPKEIGTGPLATKNLENPSASEREKTAAFDTLKSQIQRIKNDFKPSYVGVASGPLGSITQYVNEDEAAYRQVISDVKDSLLRARSGAQINEQEYARLSKLVPSVNDSITKFKGKMKSFDTTLDTLIASREKAQIRGGVGFRGKKQPTAYVYDPKTGTLKPK